MIRRSIHIDAAKAVASQLIVLHHFSVYGPMADALDLAAPLTTDWLYEYARMSVQIFLVIGGYFAASALAPHGNWQRGSPWRSLGQRWMRLVPPFVAALILTVAASAIARALLQAEFIPLAPSAGQFLAHVLLVFGVLGVEPLSAGIWYVAIDFQLFAMMALLLWGAGRRAHCVVFLFTLASLFAFNRYEQGDNWAPYFFGAYGMGAMAWWSGQSLKPNRLLWLLGIVGLAALLWDFRLRIALALAMALYLGLKGRSVPAVESRIALHPFATGLISGLARSSYALFLTHFSVLMLCNALWAQMKWTFSGSAALGLLVAWAMCVGLALFFERWIERPLASIRLQR